MMQRLCEQCKQPFTPNPRQAKQQQEQQRFCSVRCRNITNSAKQTRIKGKACTQCGRIGYTRKAAICRYCREWTPEQIAYVRNHYANDGARSVADALGCPLALVRNRANKMGLKLTKTATSRIVNAKAKAYMLKSNPMKRPEVVQKVKRWWDEHPEAAEHLNQKLIEGQQRLQRNKASKLELRLRTILSDLEINFEPSALVKPKFIVDIRIGTLIIQADGEYWHGHPRYEPLTDRQKQQRARDVAQDAYLRACGYTVVRVWDRDVTTEHIANILRQHDLL